MTTRLSLLALLVAAPLAAPLAAQERKYPAINLARVYEVDTSWPKRPADMPWKEMPGVAVDAKDNVYVFTRAKPPVQVYSPKGDFLRAWGDEIGSAHHIRIDKDGNVWTTDIDRHTVEKYTPDGKGLLRLGTPDKPGRDEAHFYMPTDVALSPSGDIFVADGYGNARIVHFDKDGKFKNAWGGMTHGHAPGEFSIPHSIAWLKGRIYVADRNNVRIQLFEESGKFIEEWRDIIVPWGFFVTPKDELWVCGSSPMQWRKEDKSLGCPPNDQLFLKLTPTGRLLECFTIPKGQDGKERPGEVNWVHCIAQDSAGNLYLGDIKGKKAQKFTLRLP